MAKVDAKFNDYVELKFENVEVKWAKVQPHQGDSFQGAPEKWTIDIILQEKLAKSLEKEGFLIKNDGTNYWITPKSAKFEKDGVTQKKPILIVGRDGQTLITEELGNGTKVNIKVSAKKWPNVSKVSTYINAIQVLKLVEFSGGGQSGFAAVAEEEASDF